MKIATQNEKVDFGIITIREDEFDAVLARFPRDSEIVGSRRYNICHTNTLGGNTYTIALVRCSEEGTGEAQDATRDMIEDLDPSWIILVGIAGGVPSDDFTLGDVVVSTRVYDFSVEAVLRDGSRTLALGGGQLDKAVTSVAANLRAMHAELAGWNTPSAIGMDRPTISLSFKKFYGTKSWKNEVKTSLARHFLGHSRLPVVVAGPIGSSDRLIKNDEMLRLLLQSARKTIAIEMELAGAYRAVRGTGTPVVSIRGISDIVGFNRDAVWTAYACQVAASFTLALLRTQPIVPHNKSLSDKASVLAQGSLRSALLMEPVRVVSAQKASKEPNEVFTPRNPQVNELMYVDRPDLERGLANAVRGSQHIIVHGESGTGKSWLYKRVLNKEGIALSVANLANASRLGSISAELENIVKRKGVGSDAFVEPLEGCLALLRAEAGGRPCCLVLDNLEAIFGNKKVMSELGEIVILLDDERYAQYGIKLILVGVPNGVREYFNVTPNRATVANRIRELPGVSRLSPEQVGLLVRRGFIDELAYSCPVGLLERVASHVNWVTNGIPQRVHEYCLELALIAQETRTLDEGMLKLADRAWLMSSLSSSYVAIEDVMNERDTKVGRRNQVLYALGRIQRDDFRYTDVEEILRSEFRDSTEGKTLNVSGLLSELSSKKPPLIRRSPKGDMYQFVDPRFRMCLRAMLVKIENRVDKLDTGNI